MSDSSGNPQEKRPDPSMAITPVSRGNGALAESSDLLLDDGFAPAADAQQSLRGPTVSVRSLLRQKWLILAVFILVAGAAIPCIWYFTVPLYTSTAVVRVQPVVPQIVYRTESNGMLPLYREYMNTQVNIIRSPKVLERVLDNKEIRNTHWFSQEGQRILRSPLQPLERLSKSLQVQTRRDTQLIGVSISTEKGAEAKLLVDTVVTEYLNLVKEQERQDSLELIGKLRDEYRNLDIEIKGLRELKRSLSKDSGLMDSMELRAQLSTKLNDLESREMEVQRELALLDRRMAFLSEAATQPAESQPAGSNDIREYARDPDWRNLDFAVKTAQHELELARDRYGDSHPRIKEMVSNVAHAESLRGDRETQLEMMWDNQDMSPMDGNPMNPVVTSLAMIQRLIPEKQFETQLLVNNIKTLRGKVKEVQDIAGIEEQLRTKEQVFDRVQERLTALELESKAPGRITIDSFGLKASEPGRDRRPLLSVMALGGAAMFALALAYLRSMSDSRIHEVGDIQTMAQAPFLGRLPALAKSSIPRELGGRNGRSLIGETIANGQDSYPDPNSQKALLEGVRMVRTALLERLGGSKERTILITSPTSQAGKTSVAFLLARSMAVTGKTVLLIEGDFYRPSLSSRLGLSEQPGLAALLNHMVVDINAIQTTSIPFLDVLPVGDVPESFTTEVLANGVFAECMARWKKAYDFVIVDSPPLLPVADARILASHADGALLVLKATHNRRPEAWSAFNQLSATPGGVLGVVMIGGESEVSGHRYGYADYPYTRNRSIISSVPADAVAESPGMGN